MADEITVVTVWQELKDLKESLASERGSLSGEITILKADVAGAKSDAKTALDLIRAIGVFSEVQRIGLINLLDQSTAEEKSREDFDKQLRVAILGILASGLLAVFVWPLLQKLGGG